VERVVEFGPLRFGVQSSSGLLAPRTGSRCVGYQGLTVLAEIAHCCRLRLLAGALTSPRVHSISALPFPGPLRSHAEHSKALAMNTASPERSIVSAGARRSSILHLHAGPSDRRYHCSELCDYAPKGAPWLFTNSDYKHNLPIYLG